MRNAALGALSGLLYVLGQPGVDIWPLSLLTFVPLLWVIERSTANQRGYRAVVVAGLASGLVAQLGMFYWLAGAVRDFVGTSLVVGALGTLGFATYHAGLFVTFAVLVRWARVHGMPLVAAATCAMCASEWSYPCLFEPYLGLSLHGVPLMLQTADLGGPLMLSALVMAANVTAYLVLFERARPGALREASAALLVWALAAAYGGYRMHEVAERARSAAKLRVGIVQTNSGVESDREHLNERIRRHVAQSIELTRARPVDLLIWPESSFGWFLPEEAKNVGGRHRRHGHAFGRGRGRVRHESRVRAAQ